MQFSKRMVLSYILTWNDAHNTPVSKTPRSQVSMNRQMFICVRQ